MINQTAKKILKALSFDGVEVEAFRHMADLKRLDPMKIFYKKVDEKIYNGSHAVPIRIFFPSEKSFRESEEKKHNIQDKKMLLFIHGGGWVTESIDNYERICARLADATLCGHRAHQSGHGSPLYGGPGQAKPALRSPGRVMPLRMR